MNIFRYGVVYDYGLAPNPFGAFCTLAVCKPNIRKNKNLYKGDWILGFGSKTLNMPCRLIYAMKVDEWLTFQEYWKDERFQYKKPRANGSLVQIYGDNIYHHAEEIEDPTIEDWIQEDSAHSLESGQPHSGHIKRDISGKRVLIAQQGNFYYWGREAIELPEEHKRVCNPARNMKYKISKNEETNLSEEHKEAFITWLTSTYEPGIHGYPTNWTKAHNIQRTFLSFEEEEPTEEPPT